jgi:N6-L-threonylcarbamoyladenine synthase
MLADPCLDMSFSGLKTAVALEIERREAAAGPGGIADGDLANLCASFQEAVVDVLVEKSRRALERAGSARLAVVGGLAANGRLRERLGGFAAERGVELRFPPVALCTDNAAMIAAVADRLVREGARAGLDLEAFSRVPLPALAEARP